MFSKHCCSPNFLEQKCTPHELEELLLNSKLKCHTITKFGLFLFTNKLIKMSKFRNSFQIARKKQKTPPPPYQRTRNLIYGGLKYCPRQLTVGEGIAPTRIWHSAAEADGKSEFIFNSFENKLVYYGVPQTYRKKMTLRLCITP
jgi:hypothetical protein